MKDKELLNIIFTRKNIEKKSWFFNADIDWNTVNIGINSDNDNFIYWNKGTWNNGLWEKGFWMNGTWNGGTWKDGTWEKGFWKKGTWIKGKIYNPKTGKYKESTLPPNKCKWSLSYGK
jgi:hypothetical protein